MMVRRILRIAMFFAGVVSALAGPVDQSFAAMSSVQYWMAGTRYAENRLYIDAVENFTLAIRTNKGEIGIEDMARVFSGRGLAYQHLEEFDKARDDFSNAIELDDRNPEHYLHRGRLFVSQKQYAKARSDFDEAVRLAPGSADGYGGRGLASLEDGDHKQAVADFEKVLSLEPRNPEALYRLGLAYKGSRQDAAALAAFDRLIDAVKKHADAAYHKAGIFARMKKIDSACVWLEIAVQDGFQEWAVLKNDGDFDAIRRNPCYLKIVAGK